MSDETTDREIPDPSLPKGDNTAPILERLYEELRALRETATRIETRLEGVETRVASLEAKVDRLDTRVDTLAQRIEMIAEAGESTRDSVERVERLIVDLRTEFRRSAVMDSELVNMRIERLEKELRVLREQQQ